MQELPFAPASERNKRPILERLLEVLPAAGSLLEVGSGTGQHAVFMAPEFPGLEWQTSDCSGEIPGLAARLGREGCESLPPPVQLDVLEGPWPDRVYQAAFSANTSHIMSWEAVCAMFAGVGKLLEPGSPFCLYGPFNRHGRFTAPSNEEFDRQLRRRSPVMGLRDLAELESLAGSHQLLLERAIDMPSNNMLLVFRKVDQ